MSSAHGVTVATMSLKGGVAKTTTAVNLAALAALEGLRTVVWDLDPQGGATWSLGVDEELPRRGRGLASDKARLRSLTVPTPWDGFGVVPAGPSLRRLERELADRSKPRRHVGELLTDLASDHDVVVVDCAPGLTLANEGVARAVQIVLSPVVPSPLAVRAFEQLQEWVRESPKARDVHVFGFLSMVDRRKADHRAAITMLAGTRRGFLRTIVPASVVAERAPGTREPVVLQRRSAVGIAYRDLWNEVQSEVLGKHRRN